MNPELYERYLAKKAKKLGISVEELKAQGTSSPVKETATTSTSTSQAIQGATQSLVSSNYTQPSVQPQPVPAQAASYPMTKQDETLRLINGILCILSCIAICWAVIPLAWAIPMTVHSWGIYKGTKPNTTAFGVCTLIFVNIIGGILLLVSNKDDK